MYTNIWARPQRCTAFKVNNSDICLLTYHLYVTQSNEPASLLLSPTGSSMVKDLTNSNNEFKR